MYRLFLLSAACHCVLGIVVRPGGTTTTQTLSFNRLFRKPLFEDGPQCVYNSECSGCAAGYKQECVANNCQCTLLHYLYSDSYGGYPALKSQIGSNIGCAKKHLANGLLVYYDPGYQKCIVEKVKKPVRHDSCHEYHDLFLSLVDGFTYCLNALSPLDIPCLDNFMCQRLIDNNRTLGLCRSGVCHAVATNNLKLLIQHKPECNSTHTLEYCRENNYIYNNVTHSKHANCAIKCMREKGVGGISKMNEVGCSCFAKYSEPETVPAVLYTEQEYKALLPT